MRKPKNAMLGIMMLAKTARIFIESPRWKEVQQEVLDAAKAVEALSGAATPQEVLGCIMRFEASTTAFMQCMRELDPEFKQFS